MGGRTWTDEQERALRRYIAEGRSHREVAGLIGRSAWAVSNRCQRLDIRNPDAAKHNSVEAQRRTYRDPMRRADITRRISASWSPERRQRQGEIARAVTSRCGKRPPSPKGRARISKGCSDWHKRQWAWLPPEYRAEYLRLMRRPDTKAAKAKEIMRAKIEAARAQMTPFERAMERIRNGANIIEVRPIRRPDPTYTLGGVSSIDGATG